MIKERKKAIHYATQMTKNGSVYCWGGQGEKISESGQSFVAVHEQNADNAKRVYAFIGKEYTAGTITKRARYFDCSGLVTEALKYAGVFNPEFDATADKLYKMLPEPKLMAAGDLVFKVNPAGVATHVGILKDLQTVIEAKGRDYGVVESKLDHSWNGVRTPY